MNGNNKPIFQLEELEDSVLYDVFYESGTILGGYLLNKELDARNNGDDKLAQQLSEESDALDLERSSIRYDDRAGQIACKRKWDERISQLKEA